MGVYHEEPGDLEGKQKHRAAWPATGWWSVNLGKRLGKGWAGELQVTVLAHRHKNRIWRKL